MVASSLKSFFVSEFDLYVVYIFAAMEPFSCLILLKT